MDGCTERNSLELQCPSKYRAKELEATFSLLIRDSATHEESQQ